MSDRLLRRILQMVSIGRTSAAAVETGGVGTVQVEFNDLATGDARKIVMHFGFYGSLPPGTDVVEVRVHGDPSNGVIIGSNNQGMRPKNLLPGEAIMYDAFGKSVYFTKNDGIVVTANNSPVVVDGATTVTINAATEIDLVAPAVNIRAP
jgi:phage gp45-like